MIALKTRKYTSKLTYIGFVSFYGQIFFLQYVQFGILQRFLHLECILSSIFRSRSLNLISPIAHVLGISFNTIMRNVAYLICLS